MGLTVLESVGFDDLFSFTENVGHIDTDDELGSSLGCEHGQDTGTTSDLQTRAVST